MSINYIHSTIKIRNFQIPVFIISLDKDSYRRSLLLEFLSEKIINNYFPASDFRDKSDYELEQFMDVNKLLSNKTYNRKLTGGEIGCADSHKSVYRYMEKNNLPFALILEDDVLVQKKWESRLEKIINDLISIEKDISYVCNIGIDYCRSVPQKTVFRSLFPLFFFSNIRLVDFSKTELWLTHSYFINLKGAKNFLNKNEKYQTTCDDWKFFFQDKTLDYVFISDCIFIQNQTLVSNIRERQIIDTKVFKRNMFFQLLLTFIASLKTLAKRINPQNWILIQV